MLPPMRRADIKPLPSQDNLLRLFAYDPLTGRLTWKTQSNRTDLIGAEVGTINTKSGYRLVGIGRIYYYAHRIIWKMMTGVDPLDQVDHRDGDRDNNRWVNLRPATNSSNLWNSKLRADNSSGFKGVNFDASRSSQKRWRAKIAAHGKIVHLGWFATPEEASAARATAALKLHGGYARLS